MVFLDPPYFLQLPQKRLVRWKVKTLVEGVDEDWDKFASFSEYDEFIAKILQEIQRLMKSTATLWVIGTYHNIHRIGKIMQDLGFWILNDVIWVKTNAMPNWLNVRFTNATETLIWAVKDKSVKGYTFHAERARQFSPSRFKLAVNVWELPICTGEERLKDDKGRKLHPTQKPEALLERVILVSTNEGDVILDPMCGTGTTGVVAMRHRRHFIMVEKERKYVEACVQRLQKEQQQFRIW
jgi:DNA modification methylase